MSTRAALIAVLTILLLRLGIGIDYSLSVPAWEAYDEPGHFSYAVTLANLARLPTTEEAAQNPEAIQPPLYYALMAVMLRISGTDTSGFQLPDRNPQFYANNGSVNYALHRSQPSASAERDETALHFLRLFTLLFTLPAVAFAYRLVRLLGAQHFALCTFLFALWPQALFNGAMVTNDALTLTLGTLITWLLVRALRVGMSLRAGMMILLVIGIGAMVKLNLLLMLIPFGVAIVLKARRRVILIVGAVVVGIVSVIVLGSVPGILLPFNNLSAIGESMLSAIWRNLTSDGGWMLVPDGLRYLVHSSVGLFGWGNVALPAWAQGLIVVLLALAVIGGVRWLIIERRIPQQTILLIMIVAAQIVGGMALMLFYQTIHLLNGRYLLPALSAICVMLVSGWVGMGRRGERLIGVVVIGVLLAGFVIPAYIAGFYQRPPAVTDSYPIRTPREFQSGMRLVGYTTEGLDRAVFVTLYWSISRPVTDDYFVRIEVIGADGNGYGLFDSIPGHGNHPTTNWIVGEIFGDDYRVPIRSDAPASQGHIRVTMIAVKNPKDRVSFDLIDAPFDLQVLR